MVGYVHDRSITNQWKVLPFLHLHQSVEKVINNSIPHLFLHGCINICKLLAAAFCHSNQVNNTAEGGKEITNNPGNVGGIDKQQRRNSKGTVYLDPNSLFLPKSYCRNLEDKYKVMFQCRTYNREQERMKSVMSLSPLSTLPVS